METAAQDQMQNFDGADVFCFQERLIPVLHPCATSDNAPKAKVSTNAKMTIYGDDSYTVAIASETIEDLLPVPEGFQPCSNRQGVIGSLLWQGHVVEIIDVPQCMARSKIPSLDQQ